MVSQDRYTGTCLTKILAHSWWELVIVYDLFNHLKVRSSTVNLRIYLLQITYESLIDNLTEPRMGCILTNQ